MRVLLIEDDSAVARSVELMLGGHGFNVYTTDLGEEGIDLGKLYDYDIIILDLNLPDMHGYDVLRKLRAAKVAGIKVPDLEVHGDAGGLLVVGWGSTYGAIRVAVDQARRAGLRVGHAHIRNIHPLPANTDEVLRRYDRVIVPEMNLGQLVKVLRDLTLIDCVSVPKVKGQAFKVSEVLAAIRHHQVVEAK